MMMAKKLLLLLVVLVIQFNSITAAAVKSFEVTKKAVEKQEKYQMMWNDLIKIDEIKKETIKINDRKYDIYKFEGKRVQNMKVKEAFYMLQNWLHLVQDAKHRIVEMNIGGKLYRFRISLNFFGKTNIIIKDESGGSLKKYEDYFKELNKGDIKEIARLMLESSREPMNKQTQWSKDIDDRYGETMREMMVVTQVAEAARPTEESFKKLSDIMTKVTEIQLYSEETSWDKHMKNLLKNHENSLSGLNEEGKNKLRKWLLTDNMQLRESARKLVKSSLTPDEFLRLLPSDIPLPKVFTDDLIKTATTVIVEAEKEAQKSWLERVGDYKPKNGRIPGSDKLVRQILLRIQSGEFESFKDAFDELFPLSKRPGGTQEGRNKLFDLSDEYKQVSESDSDESPRRRQREPTGDSPPRKEIKTKDSAVGDGDKSVIEEKVKSELEGSSCKRRKKRAGTCTLKRLKVIDDSFKWKGNTLLFETINEDGNRIKHSIEIDLEKISTPEYTKEHLSNLEESGLLKATETTGKVVGVYGATVGVLASIQYFSQEEYGRAAFSAIQAAHALGGLTGVNDVVAKVTKQAIHETVTLAAEKLGLEKTIERMSELGTKAFGESTSKVLSRFTGDLPFVGIAFDLYFISEDIKDLTDGNTSTPESLKIVHLILDVDTTLLTLIETAQPELAPFLEPVVIGLTIVRISIDNFYLEIEDKLSKVKGKGFGEQVGAFLKGFVEGIGDFFTLGLIQQIKGLQRQKEYDNELLRNLSNPASYFNVTFQGVDEHGESIGTVDFTAGILSQFGGFLTVKLNDNGSFTVELPEVPTESGIPRRVVRTFSFSQPVNDIVLGVGEVASPQFNRKQAKLWLLIPVKDFDIIDGFDAHQSSQYGIYTGNDEDNNFYAVQGNKKKRRSALHRQRHIRSQQLEKHCPSFSQFDVHLNSYHYDLYGRGGNDRFFLGPQTTRVSGGNDNDLYYVHAGGGKTIIDNFAQDQEMDTLFLNVSYNIIRCERREWDLLIKYCQESSHAIKIRNWFVHGNEEFHRHIYLATMDGVVVEVTNSELNNNQHQVNCNAISVDKSGSTSAETLVLTGSLSEVRQATGSNFSDSIIGNEKSNVLYGGLGDDEVRGENGSDIYLVKKGSGIDTIFNYATDEQEDTIVFGILYREIVVEKQLSNLIICDSRNRSSTQAVLYSWFSGPEWQHAVFISADGIRFVVKEDDYGIPRKHPLSIDLSEYQFGVRLNLQNSSDNWNISVNEDLADEVKIILDSPHDDTLIGNGVGNFLTCSGGSDFLQGNGGKDTYIIEKTCASVTIQNFDEKGYFDMILLKCSSSDTNLAIVAPSDLLLTCNCSDRNISVLLEKWFQSPTYQHLIVKTSDKISALLPENTTEMHSTMGQLFPYQIEANEDCEGEHRVINLTITQYSKCERFIAKTDACSYSIIGNRHNNYIDPGPGNPYGYQVLRGNNGSDTYVMGHRYGTYNEIDNFAEDKELDHLKFDIVFHDIEIFRNKNDAILTSRSMNDSVKVTVSKYYEGMAYQHLLIHSIDGVLFKLNEDFPYMEVIIADFSTSTFSQVMSAQENSTFSTARLLLGSKSAENYIQGGRNTTKIFGGEKNDTIIGGPGGEDLIGFSGADLIFGGPGKDALYGGDGDDYLDGGLDDDTFYGGKGADIIIGGLGSNTVVFSGYNFTGVTINLQLGLGWDADAEGDTYKMINNILASEYDDFIVGNDADNIIRGYGGNDFIFPAGGDDILQGGTGSDIYQLDNAFGHKVINNFATDEELDLILMNQTFSEDICYYFYGEDLQINIDFSNSNATETVIRISLGEDFLMITLPFWLRNSTYRHVTFSFLDGYLYSDDFNETDKQLEPMIDLIRSGEMLYIASGGSDIILHFNISTLPGNLVSLQNTLSLEYVHIDHNSTTYFPLNLPPPESIRITDLSAGSHSFSLLLSTCQLTVAISPLVYSIVPPNQPSNIVADSLFDGFVINWIPPDEQMDPLVDDYKYIIELWSSEQSGERFKYITNSTALSIFSLIPETAYNISVSSLIYNTTSHPLQVQATTAGNACTNLINLPPHMYVEDLTRNEGGEITAIVNCEAGFSLEGNSNVICNDTTAVSPHCSVITCTLPFVSNAEVIIGNDSPRYGDEVVWRCGYGYETPSQNQTFGSTCLQQSWSPAIQSCHEKPKCTALTNPQNGYLSATSAYVGETVTYYCASGYTLHGPVHKSCNRDSDSPFWMPTEDVSCEPLKCPSLLQQTHGYYNDSKSNYVTGAAVELTCYQGYFAKNDQNHPEKLELVCHGHDWNPSQRHCQLIIQVSNIRHYISYVDISVQYIISAYQGIAVDPTLYHLACQQVLTSYNGASSGLTMSPNTIVQCTRNFYLANGPNNFEGILKISARQSITDSWEYVCIQNSHPNTASEVCRQLGYGQYTSFIYHSAISIRTAFESTSSSSTELIPRENDCNYRIGCRKQCDQLYLLNGYACSELYEGQVCHFSCNTGYYLVGSSSRTCTSTGWTGTHPVCDGTSCHRQNLW